jgi:hypothetical protein
VAELRARGLTLPEIGRCLGMSRQLVHYHVRLAEGPRHRVSLAHGDRLVTGEGATAAEAWAEAEWQVLCGAPGVG